MGARGYWSAEEGASQFFTYIGLLVGPVVFAALLSVTDSYRVTLIVFAVMIIFVGLSLSGFSRKPGAGVLE